MSSFDSEEHFFLALNAISEKAHDRAIDHLKEITSGEYYSRAVYLLGAEYAEIGMYERAKQSFQSIIDLDPLKEMVRLQKGLLHIFLGEQHEARLCLGQLVEIQNKENFIYWFAQGMMVSLDSQNQHSIECLKKGIELNEVNEPLNEDMRKYIEKLSVLPADMVSESSSEHEKIKKNEINNKFFLTNYKDES